MKFGELELVWYDQEDLEKFFLKNPRFRTAEILDIDFLDFFSESYEYETDRRWMVSLKNRIYSVILSTGGYNYRGRRSKPGVKFKRAYLQHEKKIRRKREVNCEWKHTANVIEVSNRFKNDCQIMTLAKCLNLTYNEAYEELATNGWSEKNAGSTWSRNWKGIFEKYGKCWEEIWWKHTKNNVDLKMPGCTLSNITKYLPKEGTFGIGVKNHILCVVDGIVYDSCFKPNSRVVNVFKVS